MPERLLAAALLLAVCACTHLLPREQDQVASPWHSFEDARATIEMIVPERTTAAELREMGIDPYANPNVQLLSFSDILLRFPVRGGASERLDEGLRTCLDAGKSCAGYSVSARETRRDRVGGFWEDALGFKRVVDTRGWSFNALILLVDGRVVYTVYGGQPNLETHEVSRQPLGPLQNWGDAVPGLIH